jgi:hypothetical protein
MPLHRQRSSWIPTAQDGQAGPDSPVGGVSLQPFSADIQECHMVPFDPERTRGEKSQQAGDLTVRLEKPESDAALVNGRKWQGFEFFPWA